MSDKSKTNSNSMVVSMPDNSNSSEKYSKSIIESSKNDTTSYTMTIEKVLDFYKRMINFKHSRVDNFKGKDSVINFLKYTDNEIDEYSVQKLASEYSDHHAIIDDLVNKWDSLEEVIFVVSAMYRSFIDYSKVKFHYIRMKNGYVVTFGYLYIPQIKKYIFTSSTCNPADTFRKVISRDKIIGRMKSGSFIILNNMREVPDQTLVDENNNLVISDVILEPGITSYKNIIYNIALNIIFNYFQAEKNRRFKLYIPYKIYNELNKYLVLNYLVVENKKNINNDDNNITDIKENEDN